ncbi:MAG: hypothetical protein C5B60_07825 [Chloroflexi bacterium]|nr:MAG: hypothetical protein C5B60_07825 [Chloroflexota bacterium]
MSDETEQLQGQPEQEQGRPEQPQGNGRKPETESGTDDEVRETIRQEVFDARQLVPTVRGVVRPADLAGFVTYAQTMAKSIYQLPEHLHDNPGDCLAIAELAFSRNMLPYAVGKLTYVQNKQLCYMSQLYIAFANTSGELLGSLHYEWIGEGEEMYCEVTGRLKRDPADLKVMKSMPLSHARPPRNEKGQVRGSPEWDRKPRKQIAYDTGRDWVRLYAPETVLGLYTRDEIIDYEAFGQPTPDLKERLAGGERVHTGEGFDEAHIASELARSIPAPEPAPEKAKPIAARRKPQERSKRKVAPPALPRRAKPVLRAPQRPRRQQPPTRAEVKRAADRATKPPQRKPAPPPAWFDYVTKVENWMEAGTGTMTGEAAWKRWDSERDQRDKLGVPIKERERLSKIMREKFGESP